MSKISIGIIFGGNSREREISFAGGRTVYDNLNKSIFEAIPLFVDSFGNFVELNWEFVYKGTIRDFYPPIEFLPKDNEFQLYAEQLGDLNLNQQQALTKNIGKSVSVDELKTKIDFAFLCLHGPNGEDGKLQGLLEYYKIPYSGSGVLASAIGIDKQVQKELMVNKGFKSPKYLAIERSSYINGELKNLFSNVKTNIGLPCVVKPANQGSSIGVTILNNDNEKEFFEAIEKAFFTKWVDAKDWQVLTKQEKSNFVKQCYDIREGIGMPLIISYPKELRGTVIYQPTELIEFLDKNLTTDGIILEALDTEKTVLVEQFIDGKEFSCIVLENENGLAIALPPTEIRKGKELFDYRSKYLPGLSRKITPIDLPVEQIQNIRKDCEKLFYELHFDVYARIDGFLSKSGDIYLNDPNTTSGMMPSSFFFHQAAEIGLNPSQFLTFIIRTSVAKRIKNDSTNRTYINLLKHLDSLIIKDNSSTESKTRVAVILGGYSSERHISVESGRNVYEKLASSEKYAPFPVFLTGSNENHALHLIPINLMLKDNADDIKEKAENYKVHREVSRIIEQCQSITNKYAAKNAISEPKQITYQQLKGIADEVFIALHGRPGEDGAVQSKLDELEIPYNGSNQKSSTITIDKYRTNEILKQHGFLVANHCLITLDDWEKSKDTIRLKLEKEIKYPFIAKPVDDGCSSAVKKIKDFNEFEAFAKLIFRKSEELDPQASQTLHIKPKEEFPQKQVILVEELISKKNAKHFLEITGGMLTQFDDNGELRYEVFEASEALADGDVLSLEEKFLAGQGQNITPARYAVNPTERQKISTKVKETLGAAAKVLEVSGYCRIDAFVRVFDNCEIEVIFIEVNSLPGMTPATCIFHQAAINNYRPYEFIDKILDFGLKRKELI
jgi:D-alanine-D-alanine ligase